jgi:hypothetical protein
LSRGEESEKIGVILKENNHTSSKGKESGKKLNKRSNKH